ncbi:MAG: GNAT family N-acetyltransferase [Armatimonadetes bacterium]|nr:GNAT family N-acetyltransferase [Armatimonadota bacterium]
MSTTLVRWATRWDRTALIAMVQALAQQHGVEASEDTIGAAFEFALGNPGRVRFAVAQRDDQLVGTASLHEAYSTWRAALYGTIEDFYVVPEMRGQGVGTELLTLLVEEARRRGYCRLQLQVQEDNDRAWQFYEARGFRFTGYLVYEQDLADNDGAAGSVTGRS